MLKTEPSLSAKEIIEQRREAVESSLTRLELGSKPALLYDPVRYVLSGGGKRIRPVMFLLTAEAYGAAVEEAMPGALALEVFHNFTLVHDDIMDHAQTRRGNPTVHAKWDEGTAILCGDYLVALSFDLLTRLQTSRLPEILNAYHRMVRLLCEGQMLDKEFETRRDVSVDDYIAMIDRKTSALIQAVFEIAASFGGADPGSVRKLVEMGLHVGRAFQIQDDLLDLTAETPKWGKRVGGDLIEGKKAFLLLRALESTDEDVRSFFERIVEENGLHPDEIPTARALLEKGGILEDARQAVAYHSSAARDCLEVLPESPASKALGILIASLQARMH